MDNIERFMKREIGLDVLKSEAQDVDELSRKIDWFYADKIDYKEMIEAGFNSLYDYWQDCVDDDWLICVYEPNFKGFNAYKNDTAKLFKKDHDVLTASEIIEVCVNYEVGENEVINLLEVK